MKKRRPANRIGRKRRVTGWMLLTLGLLVAGVWVWSGWWSLELDAGGTVQLRVWCGEFTVALQDELPSRGWSLSTHHHRLASWRLRELWLRDAGSGIDEASGVECGWFTYGVALWPAMPTCGLSAALLLRSGIVARRRAQSGKCKACGYDLAGLPPSADARCPECGKQQTSHG